MTDPTTIALAREVLATERTRYHGQPERTDEALARALLEAQEEGERLRGLLKRAQIWVPHCDEALDKEIDAALAAATRERDEALAVLGECRDVLEGMPYDADESGSVRALLSRIDALTAKGEGL